MAGIRQGSPENLRDGESFNSDIQLESATNTPPPNRAGMHTLILKHLSHSLIAMVNTTITLLYFFLEHTGAKTYQM